jgi:hypothetical protein
MVPFLSQLRAFDMYADNPSFFVHDGDRRGPQRNQKRYQSLFGAFFYLIVCALAFSYVVHLIVRMYSLDDDDYKSLIQVNPYDARTETLKLGDLNVFWSIDIRKLDNEVNKYDVFR